MKKRFLGILLALCMVTQFMPTGALAAQETSDGSGEQARASTNGAHTHGICGEANCAEGHGDDLTWTAWTRADSLPTAPGNYYLTTDVNLSERWECSWNINLCLNGKTITAPDYSYAIRVVTGHSLAITDCQGTVGKITHKEGTRGGGINNYGTLTLWNGSIAGNSGTYNIAGVVLADIGGGVANIGTFVMHGGSITGNVGYSGGGVYNAGSPSIYSSVKPSFTMTGGSIDGNSALSEGGGVDNDGTFTMSGGSITGNSAKSHGGGVMNPGTLNLSGDVTIRGNTVGDVANNVHIVFPYVTTSKSGRVNATGPMGERASVGITAGYDYGSDPLEGTHAVVRGTTDIKGFFSDDTKYVIVADEASNALKRLDISSLSHKHKVCGVDGCTEGHGDELTWEVWTKTDSLPTAPGNYFLINSVTLASTWECGVDINLCLNGKTITGPNGKEAIKVNDGASLAITDCQGTAGKITHKSGEGGSGINNCGTLTFWNGSIAGNLATSFNGGGVYNTGTFTMMGGSIAGNSAFLGGGGVYDAGTFTMMGGSIAGNSALFSGGVVCGNDGTFTMIGGAITDNVGGGVFNSGTFNLSGDVTIKDNTMSSKAVNVYLVGGKTITVAEGGMGQNASVGIMAQDPGEGIVAVTGTSSLAGFSSDDANYTLGKGDGNVLKLSVTPVEISGVKLLASELGGEMKNQDGVLSKVYDGQAVAYDASATVISPSTVTDVTLTYTWQVKSGETYTDIAGNVAPFDAGSYRLVVTAKRDSVVLGTSELPFTITKRSLAITDANVADKTYDGTTAADVTSVSFSGLVGHESLTYGTDYAVSDVAFDSADVDKATKVNFSVKLAETDTAQNYVLTSAVGEKAATIKKAKASNREFAASGKRGRESACEVPAGYVVDGGKVAVSVEADASGILDGTPAYADGKLIYKIKESATQDQTATVKLAVTSGNYDDYTITATLGVTNKDQVKINVVAGQYTYNGAAQTPTTISVDDEKVAAADLVKTYVGVDGTSYGPSTDAPKAAGSYVMTVAVKGDDAKYCGSATCAFKLAKKSVSVKNLSVAKKVYDGTTAATLDGTPALEGAVEGDDVALVKGTPTFSAKTAGESVPVTFTDFSLTGTAAGNYTLVQPTGITGIINPKKLTVKNLTVDDKTYNGTTEAAISGTPALEGVVGDDKVAAKVASASFADKNAGTDKDVTVGVALSGEDAGNYTLDQPAGVTGAITRKELTITGANVMDKTYDATTGAMLAGVNFSGLAAGEYLVNGRDYTVSDVAFDSADVGKATKVNFSVTLAETDVTKNYVLNNAAGSQAASIKKATIGDLAFDTRGKIGKESTCEMPAGFVVDGGKVAVSVEADASGILDGTPAYADGKLIYKIKESATKGQTATVKLKVESANYTDYEVAVTIEARDKEQVKIDIADATFTYDGSAQAPTDIKVEGDDVAVDTLVKTYVRIDGATYEGSSTAPKAAGTYLMMVKTPEGNTGYEGIGYCFFEIKPKELTVAVADKTYDGTTAASVEGISLSGVVSGDAVELDKSKMEAAFDSADAGDGKTVTVSALALSGDDAGNYTLPSEAKAVAAIAAKTLTISGATVKDKTYNSKPDAIVTGVSFDGLVGGESLTFGTDYRVEDAKYDGANAIGEGAATKVTFTVDLAETGVAKNYVLKSATGSQAAGIDKATVGNNYAFAASGKRGRESACEVPAGYVVDGGEVAASVEADASGILDGTPAYADGKLTYKLKDTAAEGQTATVKLLVTSGNYKDYIITATLGVTDKEQVKINVAAGEYTYNGSAQGPADITVDGGEVAAADLVKTYVGVDGTDYGPSTEAPKAAGKYSSTVSVAVDNLEYYGSATCVFEIAKKAVGVGNLSVSNKFYDGTAAVTIDGTPALEGAVEGDDVALVNGVPTLSSIAVGEGIPVTFTDFSLIGADAANYALTQPAGITANVLAYVATGAEYAATTSDWTNQDFVVTAADGWKVSLANAVDGDWKDGLACSDEGEGSLTFYVRNEAKGYISTAVTLSHKIDKTAPAISGAQDGHTYCGPVKLTVSDVNLDTVTLNGAVIEGDDGESLALAAEAPASVTVTVQPADGEQVVVAADKAGNTTTLKFTVNDGHTGGGLDLQ